MVCRAEGRLGLETTSYKTIVMSCFVITADFLFEHVDIWVKSWLVVVGSEYVMYSIACLATTVRYFDVEESNVCSMVGIIRLQLRTSMPKDLHYEVLCRVCRSSLGSCEKRPHYVGIACSLSR